MAKPSVMGMTAFLAGCAVALLGAGCSQLDGESDADGMVYEDTDADVPPSGSPAPLGVTAGASAGMSRYSPLKILVGYDADHDGKITRAELEAGLQADFAAADANHDGKLELEEMRAVNDKRWREQGAAATPLADWNGDGVVDFDEFAAGARSLFDQVDRNHDGVLSAKELNPRARPQKKPETPKGKPPQRAGGE